MLAQKPNRSQMSELHGHHAPMNTGLIAPDAMAIRIHQPSIVGRLSWFFCPVRTIRLPSCSQKTGCALSSKVPERLVMGGTYDAHPFETRHLRFAARLSCRLPRSERLRLPYNVGGSCSTKGFVGGMKPRGSLLVLKGRLRVRPGPQRRNRDLLKHRTSFEGRGFRLSDSAGKRVRCTEY